MNTFFFSALANGLNIAFDPLQDTLFLDDPDMHATDVVLSLFSPQVLQMTVGTKSIRLSGPVVESVDSFNIIFADGSRLLVGDDTANNTLADSGSNDLAGGQFNDQLLGLDGDDMLNGGVGNDILNGGDGTDLASYADAAAAVTVSLAVTGAQNTQGAGRDTLVSIENLLGSALNDTLTGNASDNVIEGLDGNDRLNGAGGDDTVSYARASSAVTVDLSRTNAQDTEGAGTDTLSNFENVIGSAFADTLTGNAGNNVLNGGFGNDVMAGELGNDTYFVDSTLDQTNEAANAGIDTVVASVSWTLANHVDNLTLTDVSFFSVLNGTGNGLDNVFIGNRFNNILDGRAGNDTVSYLVAPNGVRVNLGFVSGQSTGWGRDTLLNIENATGSLFDDRLLGSSQNNVLMGNDGNDLLAGGAGNDTLNGGAGEDTASYFHATSGVTVNLARSGAQDTGGGGTDALTGIENVIGSGRGDTLMGDEADNVLEGLGGNDILDGKEGVDTASYTSATAAVTVNLGRTGQQDTGGAGSDTLAAIENVLGSIFNDTLTGSSGANRLDGRSGSDSMSGREGNDTYRVDTNVTQTVVVVNGNQSLIGGTFTADVVNELAGEGTDTVETFVSFVLPSNVEQLVALNLLNSNPFAAQPGLTLIGNSADNLIVDNRGGNSIDGGFGTDTVSFQNSQTAVSVNLSIFGLTAIGFGSGSDILTSIENIVGTGFDDSFNIAVALNQHAFNGGAGTDGLSFQSLSPASGGPGVTIDLGLTTLQNAGVGGMVMLRNFENLVGTSGNDTLIGAAGNNVLTGNNGSDILAGGAGDDILQGAATAGDDGAADTASYANATAQVNVDLTTSNAQDTGGAGVDTLLSIENLTGSMFHDTLTGNAQNNVLQGGLGNDVLNGAAGIDTASYEGATAGVKVNLSTTAAQNTNGAGTDTLSGIENVLGSGFNDMLTGSTGGNVFEGLGGNDTLDGRAGNDTVSYASAISAVTVSLGLTGAQNTVGAGTDTLSAIENLIGSAFNDTLTGNAGANTIEGGLGNDVLDGGDGVDTLSYASLSAFNVFVNLQTGSGSSGGGTDAISNFENVIGTRNNDNLIGNTSDNVLNGGAGADTLSGGDGADTFVFDSVVGQDTIFGFLSGTDSFQFSQTGVRIGDGDQTIDGGVVVPGPGGFAPTAELVIVQSAVPFLSDANAAAVIGAASGDYTVGATALFAVTDSAATGLFLFTSTGNDAQVSADELTQLAFVNGAVATGLGDYFFAS